MTPAGFPHSDIHGSTLESSSPWHFAGFHVLHRLLVPRHPPCALCSLTILGLRLWPWNDSPVVWWLGPRTGASLFIRSLAPWARHPPALPLAQFLVP